MRHFLALIFLLATAATAAAQSPEGKTVLARMRGSDGAVFSISIYVAPGTLFVGFGNSTATGYVCPFGSTHRATLVCEKDWPAAECSSAFLSEGSGNIRTEQVSACRAGRESAGIFCATIELTEKAVFERGPHTIGGQQRACVQVDARGRCLVNASAEYLGAKTGSVTYRSTSCRLVEGRQLE